MVPMLGPSEPPAPQWRTRSRRRGGLGALRRAGPCNARQRFGLVACALSRRPHAAPMARLVAVAVAAVARALGVRRRFVVHARGPPAARVVPGQLPVPRPEGEPADVVDHGADTLPSGATGRRLCLRDNNAAWVPPRGALTHRARRPGRVVNAQRVHDPRPTTGCGGVGAPAWPSCCDYDGGTRTITGDNGGVLGPPGGGATERFGSRTVCDAYFQAPRPAARHARPPRATHARAGCPHRVGTA